MELRQVVGNELSAWLGARRTLAVAERRLEESPDDGVRQAQVERARSDVREALTVLRAAVHAHGYSLADLQNELRTQ